jgi:hypothetical protein
MYSGPNGDNALISFVNISLVAGGNITLRATRVRAGRATWTAESIGGAAFTAYLVCQDYLGTVVYLDVIRANNRFQRRQVYLPALPVSVQFFNQDAVARDYHVMLTFQPFDD